MKIELIKIGEEEIVSAICRKCIIEINSNDLSDQQIKVLLDEFSPEGIRTYSKKFKLYVAKNDNDEIVGTGTLVDNQIKGIFIDTECLGMGIGKSIMQFLENVLIESGYKKSFLTSSNYAKDFYLKLGYKPVKTIDSVVGKMTEMEKLL